MRADSRPQKLVQSCDSADGLAAARRAGLAGRAPAAGRAGAGLAGASADAVAARVGTDAGSGACKRGCCAAPSWSPRRKMATACTRRWAWDLRLEAAAALS